MSWFRHKRRGSAGLEAVMALPVMLVLFGAVAQVMITAQSRVHLEQAAYAAARAALVHKCPPVRVLAATWPVSKLPLLECVKNRQQLDALANAKALDAARWALIAAAPTNGDASGRGCTLPTAARELLTGSDRIAGRDAAAENAICYVFEPGNVTVKVDWQNSFGAMVRGNDLPIRATVTFRYPLSTPFRRFVKDGKRGDGTYWKTGTASVTLL